jgi:hypothetical protein
MSRGGHAPGVAFYERGGQVNQSYEGIEHVWEAVLAA